MDITAVLDGVQSPDAATRHAAEQALKQLEAQSVAGFLSCLVQHLADEAKPLAGRQVAGLVLKNQFWTRSGHLLLQKQRQWTQLQPPDAKPPIRQALLTALGSQAGEIRSTAAQVLAKLAVIDLPQGEWADLIDFLVAGVRSPSPGLRQSALQAIGFTCEEMSSEDMPQEQVNKVLTAVVTGASESEADFEVRLAAMKALHNALQFAGKNFRIKAERDYVMHILGAAARAAHPRVRQEAWECLVEVAAAYYEELGEYVPALAEAALPSMDADEPNVAMQATEFWSTICEVEIEVQGEEDEDEVNHHIIAAFASKLVPVLLDLIQRQEEGQELCDETWNVASAAGVCLRLVVNTAGDDALPLVVPFIQNRQHLASVEWEAFINGTLPSRFTDEANLQGASWRQREAATFALGASVEGPTSAVVTPLLHQALPVLLKYMQDKNEHQRDTAAWALSRAIEFLHTPYTQVPFITDEAGFQTILQVLITGLGDPSCTVADKVSWGLRCVATGFDSEEGSVDTNAMSPAFQTTVQALIHAAERKGVAGTLQDAAEVDSRLPCTCYEAINEWVRCGARDTCALVAQMLPLVLHKLESLASARAGNARTIQGLLCGTLQVIVQRLGEEEATRGAIAAGAEAMAALFFKLLDLAAHSRDNPTHEEAMLALGALIAFLGADFAPKLPQLFPYMERALANPADYSAFTITVGVLGDLCTALDAATAPILESSVRHLLTALRGDTLSPVARPCAFSAFGDLALATGAAFVPYMPHVLPVIHETMQLTNNDEYLAYSSTEDRITLINALLEACAGILQGSKGEDAMIAALLPYASFIYKFMHDACADEEVDDEVTLSLVGVLGDLADVCGTQVAPLYQQHPQFFITLLRESIEDAENEDGAVLGSTTTFAKESIERIIGPFM